MTKNENAIKQAGMQELKERLTPFGLVVFEAMDASRNKTAGNIAKKLGEPVCVVQAMLDHLVNFGYIRTRDRAGA